MRDALLLMNMPLRWVISIVLSLISFGVCWWVVQHYVHVDSGVAVGVAALPFTITLTLGGVWADRARKKQQPSVPDRSPTGIAQGGSSQVSGIMTGANFGPGGDFRNSNIIVAAQDGRTDFLSNRTEVPFRSSAHQIIFGDIPQRPQSFEERSELQAKLTGRPSRQGKIWVLIGARGAGKSQLAAAIARRRITDGWRVVAWVNAEDVDQLTAELGHLAIELGLSSEASDATRNAMRVRHWLESSGSHCFLVFDNGINPDIIRQFLPAVGSAEVVVTGFRRTMASLGTSLTVNVFTSAQSVDYLIKRTGNRDEIGARKVAAELGYLPLALAQAAAVIAGQNIDYDEYRDRLAATQISDYLGRIEGDPYSLGVAEAIMLSISAAEASDRGEICRQVLELISVLSPASISRKLIYYAAHLESLDPFVVPDKNSKPKTLFPTNSYTPIGSPTTVDAVLQVLTDCALTTWSIDNKSVSIHRLVARVVRERADHDRTIGAAAARAIGSLYSMWGGLDSGKRHFGDINIEEASSHIAALDTFFRLSDEIDQKHQVLLAMLIAYRAGYEDAYKLGLEYGKRHRAALELSEQGRLDEAISALEVILEELESGRMRLSEKSTKDLKRKVNEDLEGLRQRRLE
jgi:hypothetical protein